MTKRYRGGVISATYPTPTTASAPSMYNLTEATQYKNAQLWPGSSDLNISPAVDGKNGWTFAVDGQLLITSPGEYTVTFNRDITKVVKMWGGGGKSNSGGSTGWGQGAGGGAATGTVSFTTGITYYLRVGAAGSTGSPGATAYGAGAGGGIWSGGVGTAGSGGGYTGIFRINVNAAGAVLMAGGGGGGASDRADGLGGRRGLAGGGTSGEAVADLQGGPGTQSAGGSAAGSGSTAGSALQGGSGANGGAGAGGGYFGGGGGGAHGDGGYGGGGGSGYYNPTYVTSATLYAGSSTTPGNSGDADRPTNAGAGATAGNSSFNGVILIKA